MYIGFLRGGLTTPTILESLLNAINLKGAFAQVHGLCAKFPVHSWLLDHPNSPHPAAYKGLQSAAKDAFAVLEKVQDMQSVLTHKVTVSFGLSEILDVPGSWYTPLEKCYLSALCSFVFVGSKLFQEVGAQVTAFILIPCSLVYLGVRIVMKSDITLSVLYSGSFAGNLYLIQKILYRLFLGSV